ncbi:dynein light chain Tctex-type 3 isoform X1 [Oryzias latipes]
MEDFHNGNEGSFNSEETDGIVKECIENVVGGDDYSANLVNKWTAGIVERCLTQLVKQGKPYKYIEDRRRTSHSQLLLLGHCHGRKHHRKVGKPHHVLRGQRVCGGRCLEPKGHPFKTQAPPRGCN